jgi:hypothetical protein
MTYSQLVELYTSLHMQNAGVLSFNSDDYSIIFKNLTTSEMLATSKALTAAGFKNEIIVQNTLLYKIRFI